jgi:hypothetical protein
MAYPLYPSVPKASAGYNRDNNFIQIRTEFPESIPDVVVTHDPTPYFICALHYQNILVDEVAILNNFFESVNAMADEFDFIDLWNQRYPWNDINIGTTVGVGSETFQIPAVDTDQIFVFLDDAPVSFTWDVLGDNGRTRVTITSPGAGGIVTVNFYGRYVFRAAFLSPRLPFDNDGWQYSDTGTITIRARRNDKSES